ncbi:MAG: FAD:protein FMN transferase [Candidatus Marinimicrobia bacterium]|jgi:thiamine biosynthesis lipoprotein|nr:FAD:protein FMN transferase [Candidatus Neomarinimicrobiota bacterium]MBT4636685.1 FAD:protein FMN transferase [Candidatus Neomarinimicrobiota bacterium]MBT4734904.1 FAD:protein FMN transferase [Candidatus Neomarinimicrobiota bacterium]MBT5070241.1 FAD:protein FMN transferase [Candidatus Neomarinimicrobiota bacterium]MBT6113745.1 FAD:protein FMN transferase [Candidatus Neomarinimicrobiota bacterium]
MSPTITYLKAQLLLGFLFLFVSCDSSNKTHVNGLTMGTTYEIILGETIENNKLVKLHSKIDSLLQEINQQMSIYISDSDISNFNHGKDISAIPRPNMFSQVLERSIYWYHESNGSFDITVMPLVNEWGFGNKKVIQSIPLESKIKSILQFVGGDKLFLENKMLSKTNSQIQIDLGAVAKGYAVDIIGELLSNNNIQNYYIEIGGEIKCSGVNSGGKVWTIGIQLPDRLNHGQIIEKVTLKNKAIATSGDYKNYVELDGKYYSHTINPKTGYPIDNQIASVSVMASSCMDADAIATALMIMDLNDGIHWVNSLHEIDAMWVIRKENGLFETHTTNGFLEN